MNGEQQMNNNQCPLTNANAARPTFIGYWTLVIGHLLLENNGTRE
jgi:hypothetical protein